MKNRASSADRRDRIRELRAEARELMAHNEELTALLNGRQPASMGQPGLVAAGGGLPMPSLSESALREIRAQMGAMSTQLARVMNELTSLTSLASRVAALESLLLQPAPVAAPVTVNMVQPAAAVPGPAPASGFSCAASHAVFSCFSFFSLLSVCVRPCLYSFCSRE